MPRRLDELDLLRLIEDDFDPAGDAAHRTELERAVADDPTLALEIVRAKVLRDELRRLPQPTPPRDFVACMGAHLAPSAPVVRLPRRPSAIERAFVDGWSRSWPRLAMAAAVGAAATAGVWVASTWLRNRAADVAGDGVLAMSGRDAIDGRTADAAKGGGVDLRMSGAPARTPHDAPRHPDPAAAAAAPRSAVAMVIESNHPRQVEEALRRLVNEQVGAQGALVRNFTTAEALAAASRIMDERHRERRAHGGVDGPMVADRAGAARVAAPPSSASALSREAAAAQQALLDEALAAMRRDRGGPPAASDAPAIGDLPPALGRDRTADAARDDRPPDALGAVLAGSRDAAPSPEAQLAFGDGEFALTLNVPAELLSSLLVELAYEGTVRGVALRPLDVGERPTSIDAARWRRWQDAGLDAASSGRIAVPIRIVPAKR